MRALTLLSSPTKVFSIIIESLDDLENSKDDKLWNRRADFGKRVALANLRLTCKQLSVIAAPHLCTEGEMLIGEIVGMPSRASFASRIFRLGELLVTVEAAVSTVWKWCGCGNR